jgi:acetyl esterase
MHVLERGDLTGQPPALVQLAEIDVLTPTGRQYAERLAAAGVPVRVELYPGVQHGFWRRTDNDQAGPALDDIASFLAELP